MTNPALYLATLKKKNKQNCPFQNTDGKQQLDFWGGAMEDKNTPRMPESGNLPKSAHVCELSDFKHAKWLLRLPPERKNLIFDYFLHQYLELKIVEKHQKDVLLGCAGKKQDGCCNNHMVKMLGLSKGRHRK